MLISRFIFFNEKPTMEEFCAFLREVADMVEIAKDLEFDTYAGTMIDPDTDERSHIEVPEGQHWAGVFTAPTKSEREVCKGMGEDPPDFQQMLLTEELPTCEDCQNGVDHFHPETIIGFNKEP